MQKSETIVATLGAIIVLSCGGRQGTKTTQTSTETQATKGAPVSVAEAAKINANLVFPEEDFRKGKPSAKELRPLNLPKVERYTLGGVIDVFLVEEHALPTVSMDLNFEGGAVLDKSKAGMSAMCMDLMTEGTEDLETSAYSEALADLASKVWSYSGTEQQGVSMMSLTKHFDKTFDLYTDAITKPGLRENDLARLKKQAVNTIKQRKKSAGSIAYRVLDRVLYGKNHPFGHIETETTVGRIKVSDCARLMKDTIKPKGAKLFVVGDITKAKINAMFEPLLETWQGAPKRVARLPKPRPMSGKVFFVNVPGAAQSQIIVSHFGPKRDAKDYFPSLMMTGALGGSFSSRVNMNLREDKGYSYGARGGLEYTRNYGVFAASSSVRSDATRQSLIEMFKEIDAMKSNTRPITAEELMREQNGQILGLPGEFATSRQTLSKYRSLSYFGLPIDYYNKFVDQVAAVQAEQVSKAAQTHLNPKKAIVLVVGDKDAMQIARAEGGKDEPFKNGKGKELNLLDSLKALASGPELGGKGKLVVLDADGKPTR